MKLKLFLSAIVFFMVLTAQAQDVNERYVEVTGTSEIEIVPDKIHYIIEIREYFKEEFDSKEHQIVPSAPMVVKGDPT